MSKKYKKDDHDEHMDESWLIPYADLMTLLLALFIVLYATSSVDSKKFKEMSEAFNIAFNTGVGVLDSSKGIESNRQLDGSEKSKRRASEEARKQEQAREAMMQKEQEDLEKLKKQLDQYISSNGLTTQLETRLNQSQLMVTISDRALFDSGSAVVKTDSQALATAIANMLAKYPGYEIVVSGHTDNQPISTSEFKSNWDLSSTRAIRFMDILLSNNALDPRLFSAIGYGEYRPVDTNNTNVGRSKNRRVEVALIRKFVDTNQDTSTNVPPAS